MTSISGDQRVTWRKLVFGSPPPPPAEAGAETPPCLVSELRRSVLALRGCAQASPPESVGVGVVSMVVMGRVGVSLNVDEFAKVHQKLNGTESQRTP